MEKENQNLNLPTITTNKKRSGIFSTAIFKEELKSNWLYSLIVGLGNALIIILIVSIMSTLNINATKDALSSLFDSASEETTLKTSSVSLYALYTSSAEGYLQIDDGLGQIESFVDTANKEITSSETSSGMGALNTAYNLSYRITVGDEVAKKAAGIKSATTAYNTALNTMEKGFKKDLVSCILPNYVSFYSEKGYGNSNFDYKWGLLESVNPSINTLLDMPNSLGDKVPAKFTYGDLISLYGLEKDEVLDAINVAVTNLENCYGFDSNGKITPTLTFEQAKFETALELLPTFASSSEKKMASDICEDVKEAYNVDKDAFLANKNIELGKVLKPAITKEAKKTMEDLAYYDYLPSFAVEWVTNDLGYPITYKETGDLNEDGTPVVKEIKLTSYKPELFVKVTGGMPSDSSLAQKMHKDILTGVPYSEQQIAEAKEKAKPSLDEAYTRLDKFLDDFIANKDKYTNEDGIDINAIENRVIDEVVVEAKSLVLEEYNKKYNTSYKNIEDIPSSSTSMSGKTLTNSIYAYGSSGIASYRSLLRLGEERGYNSNESMVFATSVSGLGIIDQLPTAVKDSLTEMGEMNTYGIFVGVVSFGLACVLLPLVYTIVLSSNLVASKVENGSLAFTLTTPIKRKTFVFTEAIYLVLTEIFLGLCLYLGALVSRQIGIAVGGGDLIQSLSVHDITLYALGSCVLMIGISGICFLASCFFNKSGKAIGTGGGINISFFICSILGLFGTSAIPGTVRITTMNYFNYVTILSLYDGLAVMDGDPIYWFKLIALIGIALVTYGTGIYYFDHKDLPL